MVIVLYWAQVNDEFANNWQNLKEFEDSDSQVAQWIQFDDLESKEMDSQFERYFDSKTF